MTRIFTLIRHERPHYHAHKEQQSIWTTGYIIFLLLLSTLHSKIWQIYILCFFHAVLTFCTLLNGAVADPEGSSGGWNPPLFSANLCIWMGTYSWNPPFYPGLGFPPFLKWLDPPLWRQKILILYQYVISCLIGNYTISPYFYINV